MECDDHDEERSICCADHVAWPFAARPGRRLPALAPGSARPKAPRRSWASRLRTEYKENPLGIDARKPRLSWQLVSSGRGVRQSAYEIRVARTEAAVRGRSRPRVDFGPRGLGRIDPARLRGPGAAVRAAVSLAGPRLGRRRHRVRLERARLVGDGAPRAVRLEGELDRARPPGGREDQRARAHAAPRLQARRRRRARAGLRHEPRPLRAAPERPARGRPALHPGLDELQQAPAVPDLRRHVPAEDRRQRRGRAAGQRLVPGQPGLGGPAEPLRRSPRPCCARSRSPTRTGARRSSAATAAGKPRPVPS